MVRVQSPRLQGRLAHRGPQTAATPAALPPYRQANLTQESVDCVLTDGLRPAPAQL